MTKQLTLDAFTNPAGLITLPDPLVRTGSLLLVDPTAPQSPWAAGIPSSIPNLAAASAAAMGVSGATLTLSSSVVAPNVVERTTKGGLHVAYKQGVGTTTQSLGYESAAIRNYIVANMGHSYYFGLSGIYTKDATNTPTATTRMMGIIVSSTNDVATIRPGNTAISGMPTTNRTLTNSIPRTSTGEFFVDSAWSSLTGTPGASNVMLLWHNGGSGTPAHSWVLHSAYIEDLTVSGRTAAAAHDAFALRQLLLHEPGGRYRADGFTHPNTL